MERCFIITMKKTPSDRINARFLFKRKLKKVIWHIRYKSYKPVFHNFFFFLPFPKIGRYQPCLSFLNLLKFYSHFTF